MSHPLVVHCKHEPYDVYIGRPSRWGNPYYLLHEFDRDQVIELYRTWLMERPHMIALARKELRGKILGCWCAPSACHGDILAEVANSDETP